MMKKKKKPNLPEHNDFLRHRAWQAMAGSSASGHTAEGKAAANRIERLKKSNNDTAYPGLPSWDGGK